MSSGGGGSGSSNVCHATIGPSSSYPPSIDGDVSGATRTWWCDWFYPQSQHRTANASSRRLIRLDEESTGIQTEEIQQHTLDRVALIAYTSDNQVLLFYLDQSRGFRCVVSLESGRVSSEGGRRR